MSLKRVGKIRSGAESADGLHEAEFCVHDAVVHATNLQSSTSGRHSTLRISEWHINRGLRNVYPPDRASGVEYPVGAKCRYQKLS